MTYFSRRKVFSSFSFPMKQCPSAGQLYRCISCGQCGTGQVFRLFKIKFYLKADSLTQMMKWQTSNRCLCSILWGKGCGPK